MANSINITDLEITFNDKTPIRGFCCSVSSGEKVAIMGASGCGKSTLLAALVGLVPISDGKIEICGVEATPNEIDKIRRCVAWLPQQVDLPIDTVQELFDMHFRLRVNSHIKFNQKRCHQLLEKVGLSGDILTREWRTLSGGERQRVLVVCSIMLERKVILLDEPTSALDSISRDMVSRAVSSLDGVTILCVTHDESFANTFNRVIHL